VPETQRRAASEICYTRRQLSRDEEPTGRKQDANREADHEEPEEPQTDDTAFRAAQPLHSDGERIFKPETASVRKPRERKTPPEAGCRSPRRNPRWHEKSRHGVTLREEKQWKIGSAEEKSLPRHRALREKETLGRSAAGEGCRREKTNRNTAARNPA
jgi:hypothetical protein